MGIIFYEDGIEVNKLSFENIYFNFESGGLRLSIFHHCMRKSIHLDGNIIHFVHTVKPLQNFATFTFGADIPSLGDFSGHIVILEKIRKIYFKNFGCH